MVFTIDVKSTEPMGKWEAEEITKAIQGNFNSLGDMLETARNRKAWKILGYRDFEAYCNNEFGKSQRRAYELIAEAAIAQSLKEADPSLRLPAQTNLKFLKELPIEQQIEAVKRSEWLAKESDKKKPDRSDLLIAIDEMEGCRSGDMRPSLESRGFIKGVEVATTRGMNIGSRGIITKVDKTGDIHVELHAGGKIPLDAASCRILPANEKPKKRAWEGTTDLGDKVLIFSKGLENTIGTIKSRFTSEKMVGVDVNSNLLKLPYAELEVVEVEIDEPDQDSWLQNFIWSDFGAQWCYDSESETITTVYKDLTLHPAEKGKGSPADWVRRWAKENIPNLAFDLLPLEQLSTLIKSRLITCGGEEEKGNLAESLIAEIWKMTLPSECREKVKSLISSKADKAQGISFSVTCHELLNGEKTQTRRAWQDDYARSFIRYFEDEIEIPALNKGQHRGGQEIGKIRLTEKPYQQMLSEKPVSDLDKEGAMCTTVQEFIDRFFEGQYKLVWVLDFEFVASDSESEVTLLKQRLEEAERVIGQLVECRQVDTVDTAIVNIVDTAIANTAIANTAAVNTVDTAIIDTVDTAIVDTVDTAIVDTVDTVIVDTVDTAAHTDFSSENNTSIASDADAVHTKRKEGKTWFAETLEKSMNESIGKFTIGDRVKYDLNNPDRGQELTYLIQYGEIVSEIYSIKYEPFAIVKVRFDSGIKREVQTRHLERLRLEIEKTDITTAHLESEKSPSALDCPQNPDSLVENNTSTASPLGTPESPDDLTLNAEISKWRKKVREDINRNDKKLQGAKKSESAKLEKALDDSYSRLLELDTFGSIKIGQIVEKKVAQGLYGKVTRLDFSHNELPQVWINWGKESSECSTVASLNLSPVSEHLVADAVTDTEHGDIGSNVGDTEIALERGIAERREFLSKERETCTESLNSSKDQEVRKNLKRRINRSDNELSELNYFEKTEIGEIVERKNGSGINGKITKRYFSPGGLPQFFVKWEDKEYSESANVCSVIVPPIAESTPVIKEAIAFREILPEQLNEH